MAANPVEPDLALHQSLPDLHRKKPPRPSPQPCWTWPGSAPKPPRPYPEPSFSGTLLNLTWLCTKASHTFSGTFSGTLLNLTWLCTKAYQTFSGTFSGTSLNLTRRLHQCTPELFWAEDPISLRCWGKKHILGLLRYFLYLFVVGLTTFWPFKYKFVMVNAHDSHQIISADA